MGSLEMRSLALMDLRVIKFWWLNIQFWRISQAFTDHLWLSWHDSQNTKVLEKAVKHSMTLWVLIQINLLFSYIQVIPGLPWDIMQVI